MTSVSVEAPKKVIAKKPAAKRATPKSKLLQPIVAPVVESRPSALALIATVMDDAKAENITTINLAGKTSLADHMIVATGRSDRHVGAIAAQIISRLKDDGFGNAKVEGMPLCEWVLIDAGDIIVHIFRPEVRNFYNLEKMWSGDRPDEKLREMR